jgi:hypothetical protein
MTMGRRTGQNPEGSRSGDDVPDVEPGCLMVWG